MSISTRDMADYVKQYRSLPFEPIQIEYRRKLVLKQVELCRPKRLLEVGCGDQPLFTSLPSDMLISVVEPAQAFVDRARELAAGRSLVQVTQGLIESVALGDAEFDMVVLSCVLHEVPDPSVMLAAIRRLCARNATLHVNVPNAHSLRHLLAVAMGLISSPDHKSDTQQRMQQRNRPYDTQSLRAELSASGFCVIEQGSFFVKPFTHSQMQTLVDIGFMTSAMLEGLDKLINWMPDMGSEIWANAQRV